MKYFLLRGGSFLYGIVLYFLFVRRLKLHELVKGKRVAIIGPANSSVDEKKGTYIDEFDIVIRINKAPSVIASGKFDAFIGTKVDMLFHSFFENTQSGGGPLDIALFESLGIRYLVNPVAEFRGYRVIFNFFKKYKYRKNVYVLPAQAYRRWKKKLNGYQPTIGFCALMSLLECDFEELFLSGFTFFKTGFAEGYRDNMRESTQVQEFIRNHGLHNPEMEFEIFRDAVYRAKGKKILTDRTLNALLYQ